MCSEHCNWISETIVFVAVATVASVAVLVAMGNIRYQVLSLISDSDNFPVHSLLHDTDVHQFLKSLQNMIGFKMSIGKNIFTRSPKDNRRVASSR